MEWIKKGLIFEPNGGLDWMKSHAAIPFAQNIDGDLFRVYCTGRDSEGRSQIGSFEIVLDDSKDFRGISENPAIELGSLGSFDDRGLTSSWVEESNDKLYQYYSGWSLGVTVPFYFYIGLAISEDGGKTFQKVSESPVLGRNEVDPYLTASPCILIENNTWRMWYVSGVGWEMDNGEPKHYYHIKYAESRDGINWHRTGKVCIDFDSEDEYAIARPCVIKDRDIYKMWYCYRGNVYRIGYAESEDGLDWERKDDAAGIFPSEEGWDSEMVAYPFVFKHGDELFMMYNGNGYGKSGIGLAVLSNS
ncbi:MAG: hypothetical protein E2O79_09580 [Caldithrix sp.]|nr:MAG: hypothetical protein E2O79_09580 [Caldithrix sp.]